MPRTAAGKRRQANPPSQRDSGTAKRPFDIKLALRRIRRAIAPFPKAALFELAAQGFDSPIEQLVACIISIRTRDETTVPAALRLFNLVRRPEQIAALSAEEIDGVIRPCTFHESKARQIQELATRVAADYGGQLPCDRETLLSFRGVGPKCANLALGIACGEPLIGVDIHVHRVANRWGYVQASSPEKTMSELMSRLPRRYWIELNSLLVPFGKHICTGRLPKCSDCPVLEMCRQVGVKGRR